MLIFDFKSQLYTPNKYIIIDFKCSIYFDEKVANHNKKQKKQAKKNSKEGRVKQIKKDLGVPNSAPFKEEVLGEAELQKQIVCH